MLISILEVKIKVDDGGFPGVARFHDISYDRRTGRICKVNSAKEMGMMDRPENGLPGARYKIVSGDQEKRFSNRLEEHTISINPQD